MLTFVLYLIACNSLFVFLLAFLLADPYKMIVSGLAFALTAIAYAHHKTRS